MVTDGLIFGQKREISGSVFLGSFGGLVQHLWCFFHVFLWFFLLVFERILLVHSIFFGDRWFPFAYGFILSICHLAG